MANITEERMTHVTVHGSGVAFEMETLVTDREAMGEFVTSLVNRSELAVEGILAIRGAISVDGLIDIVHAADVDNELRFL